MDSTGVNKIRSINKLRFVVTGAVELMNCTYIQADLNLSFFHSKTYLQTK